MQKKAKTPPTRIDKELLMMVALFVIAAAGITIFFIIPQISPPEEISLPTGFLAINITNYSENQLPQSITECLFKYNIESNRVFFIYSDTCIYSNKMKLWVQQLETEGYKFLWIDIRNESAIQITSACLGSILKYEGTPEFICPIKEKSVSGTFSNIEEMKSFSDDCK